MIHTGFVSRAVVVTTARNRLLHRGTGALSIWRKTLTNGAERFCITEHDAAPTWVGRWTLVLVLAVPLIQIQQPTPEPPPETAPHGGTL